MNELTCDSVVGLGPSWQSQTIPTPLSVSMKKYSPFLPSAGVASANTCEGSFPQSYGGSTISTSGCGPPKDFLMYAPVKSTAEVLSKIW